MPRRARRRPSIMPAGPPPTMQQGVCNSWIGMSDQGQKKMACPPVYARLDRAAVEERVLLVNQGRRLRKYDGNGVEANLVPGDTGARGVTSGSADNVFLLLAVNGAFGAAEFVR